MDRAMSDLQEEYQRMYCPPLESALVAAMLWEYGLEGSADALLRLRAQLDLLRDAAGPVEEEDGVRAHLSEHHGRGMVGATGSTEEASGSSHATHDQALSAHETDASSVSDPVPPLDVAEAEAEAEADDASEGAEDRNGEQQQQHADSWLPFEHLDADANFASRSCAHSLPRVFDELLNLVFLDEIDSLDAAREEEEEPVPMGVDGFADARPSAARRGKRHHDQHQRRRGPPTAGAAAHDEPGPRTGPGPAPAPNQWDEMAAEIDFLATRLHIPPATMRSQFHQNQGSLAVPLRAILASDEFTNADACVDDDEDPSTT
ncbi:MAG: hypothetical protein M1826_002171 [Phylliscum demangeonii]|nr:MAG: hypothetical protein M1826_002171 [Phylliscum demangeonii]